MRDSEIEAPQPALLACPHCGGPGRVEDVGAAKVKLWHRVRCQDYDCGATTWAMVGVDAAIRAWNRRNGEA